MEIIMQVKNKINYYCLTGLQDDKDLQEIFLGFLFIKFTSCLNPINHVHPVYPIILSLFLENLLCRKENL
jgi:hypothetical protein